jgi:hypothetical protein
MFDVFQTSTVSQVDLSKMTHFDKMAALVHRKVEKETHTNKKINSMHLTGAF